MYASTHVASPNHAATTSQASTNRPRVTSARPVPRTAESPTRALVRELSFSEHDLAIHEHVLDACGGLVRVFEGGAIDDGRRIEDGNVGEHSGTKEPALGEPDALRRE